MKRRLSSVLTVFFLAIMAISAVSCGGGGGGGSDGATPIIVAVRPDFEVQFLGTTTLASGTFPNVHSFTMNNLNAFFGPTDWATIVNGNWDIFLANMTNFVILEAAFDPSQAGFVMLIQVFVPGDPISFELGATPDGVTGFMANFNLADPSIALWVRENLFGNWAIAGVLGTTNFFPLAPGVIAMTEGQSGANRSLSQNTTTDATTWSIYDPNTGWTTRFENFIHIETGEFIR